MCGCSSNSSSFVPQQSVAETRTPEEIARDKRNQEIREITERYGFVLSEDGATFKGIVEKDSYLFVATLRREEGEIVHVFYSEYIPRQESVVSLDNQKLKLTLYGKGREITVPANARFEDVHFY